MTERPAPASAPIVVAVPGVVVLVGAAGSGKSTLAAARFDPSEVVSSDALREAVAGDPTDQRATRLAFSILHREVRRRLASGRLVVVDATNVERHARLALVRIARSAGAPLTAIVLLADGAAVHARNAGRPGRVVPADVVDRHLAALGRLGDDPAEISATLRLEGFTAVHLVDGGGPPPAIERRSRDRPG
jgi:protein phosphatase